MSEAGATVPDLMGRLSMVALGLRGEVDPSDVVGIMLQQGIGGLGADGGTFAFLDEHRSIVPFRTVGYGAGPDRLAMASLGLDRLLPLSAAALGDEAVWIPSAAFAHEHFPALIGQPTGSHAWAAVPLVAGGVTFAVMGFGFAEQRAFGGMERHFLNVLGALGAASLDSIPFSQHVGMTAESLHDRELRSIVERVEIVVLDTAGVIVDVNQACITYGGEHGFDDTGSIGLDFLALCDTGSGGPGAAIAATAIRSALRGETHGDVALRIPCQTRGERWYEFVFTPRFNLRNHVVGVTMVVQPSDL